MLECSSDKHKYSELLQINGKVHVYKKIQRQEDTKTFFVCNNKCINNKYLQASDNLQFI